MPRISEIDKANQRRIRIVANTNVLITVQISNGYGTPVPIGEFVAIHLVKVDPAVVTSVAVAGGLGSILTSLGSPVAVVLDKFIYVYMQTTDATGQVSLKPGVAGTPFSGISFVVEAGGARTVGTCSA